jgi:hypothetical protein
VAPSPLPTPVPIPTPSPTAIPLPTPIPIPSIPPRTPLFPVPPPNPLPQVAPPQSRTTLPFLSGTPDLNWVERAVPVLQVWRAGATLPQLPVRRARSYPVRISGSDPVTLVFQWDVSVAGKTVEVGGVRGATIQPEAPVFTVGPTGEATLIVQLNAGAYSAELNLTADFVTTTLHIERVPLSMLTAAERHLPEGAR